MLKYRLLTAFLMGPLILWAIYAMPEQYFSVFALVLVSLGAWEWSAFSGWVKPAQRATFFLLSSVLFSVILFLQNEILNISLVAVSLLWWAICIPLLRSFPFNPNNLIHKQAVTTLIGVILLLGTFVSMILIRNNPSYGSEYVLYLIFIIWFADSGAYFAGRSLGKNKLIPNVSPGKTWEGVAGAFIVTLIVAIASINILDVPTSQAVIFIIITELTVLYSIVGDLSESMFKRMANIKDSGHILPGHGGILDRIDSLMSGFPVFFAGLMLMENLG